MSAATSMSAPVNGILGTVSQRVRQRARALVATGIWCVAALICTHYFAIVHLESESINARFVLIAKHATPAVGDFALYGYSGVPVTPYPAGSRMVHQIVAQAGDPVENRDGQIYAAGALIGRPKTSGPRVGMLTPIVPPGVSLIIPEGYVFLASPHELGFDSRYAQHGLVPTTALRGVAYRLF